MDSNSEKKSGFYVSSPAKAVGIEEVARRGTSLKKSDLKEARSAACDDLKQQLFSKSPERQNLVAASTKGEGDCALHAVLGEWDPSYKWYVCTEVASARQRLCHYLLSDSSREEPVKGYVETAIRELIMSDQRIPDEYAHMTNLREEYLAFLSQNFISIATAKREFISAFSANAPLMAKIGITPDMSLNEEVVYLKFSEMLARDDSLLDEIRRVPEIFDLWSKYDRSTKYEFNWEEKITPGVRQAHADYVRTPGVYLLPSEIAIIAHAFDRCVEYYPAGLANVHFYNRASRNTVHVQYNGHGHFERMQPKNPKKSSVKSKISATISRSALEFPVIGSSSTNASAPASGPALMVRLPDKITRDINTLLRNYNLRPKSDLLSHEKAEFLSAFLKKVEDTHDENATPKHVIDELRKETRNGKAWSDAVFLPGFRSHKMADLLRDIKESTFEIYRNGNRVTQERSIYRTNSSTQSFYSKGSSSSLSNSSNSTGRAQYPHSYSLLKR